MHEVILNFQANRFSSVFRPPVAQLVEHRDAMREVVSKDNIRDSLFIQKVAAAFSKNE